MTVTRDQVREELNAGTVSVSDAKIDRALDVIAALVDKKIGATDVPAVVRDEAVLAAAVEKIHIDQAPNGVLMQQYDIGVEGTSVPVRIGRDPMKAAEAVLAPYLSGKFTAL